ncbi:MAG: helix-turn-helix transcriptional regulator [Oscillospiraceae bacterium]|nr:helix-turn-helix transcriptional regulator [Oscillospiraceae bacterium]
MKIYWSGDSKNVIGPKVRTLRKEKRLTQKALAERLQLAGYDFTDLTVLRIENGTRFVPDYEVKALAKAFGVTYAELLGD